MKITNKSREALNGLSFTSLWIIGFLVFTLYPLIQTFQLSLNEVTLATDGIKTSYLGLENYKRALLLDSTFTNAVFEYLSQIIVYVPVIVVFSMMIAILLNTKIKGRGIFRTIFFLPVIITSGPVINKLVSQGASSLPGINNFINLEMLSENLPAFIADTLLFLISSFVMILWFSGIQILIFLAVLQKMDKNMYEAASIDGASAWESFWKLTLPALNPSIVVVVIFTVVMQSLFTLNPVITKIQDDMHKTGYGYGYASAMAWIYFVVLSVVLVLFTLLVMKREKKIK